MTSRCLAAALAATMLSSCGPSRDELAAERYRGFQEAREAGDREGAMAFLAPTFFMTAGGGESFDRGAMQGLFEWDEATGLKTRWEEKSVDVEDGVVSATFTEFSAFYDLVGAAGGRKTRQVVTFDRRGLIQRIDHSTVAGQIPLREKLAPFLDWARKKRPGELNAIFLDGRIHYSKEDAERWLALLREWRDDIRLP